MKKLLLLLAVFLSLGIQAVIAQSGGTVSGRLLDENGEGLPSASVTIKGMQAGTITDIDGNFQIALPEGKNVIIVKAIGYAPKEIKVTNPNEPLNVTMEKSSTEIVAEIYGRKIDPKTNVGSVTTVKAEDIEKKTITNVVNALQGSNGINITSGGGQPGSEPDLHVRGFGSLSASSAPIVVLDGMVYDGSLSSINPNDVESISLLKDATASSLYGNRGSNGVILVTSKRGTKGDKPQIKFGAQTGIMNRMLPRMATIGIQDYYEVAFQMVKNYLVAQGQMDANGSMSLDSYWSTFLGGYNAYDMSKNDVIDAKTGKINPNAKLLWNDDWMDALGNNNALRQQYDLSVSHASDKSDYYFSLGYNRDEGIVKYTNYNRLTMKLNVNSNITDWLKSGVDFSGMYEDQRNFTTSSDAYSNPFMTAQLMAPIFPIYKHDASGNVVVGYDGEPEYDFGDNPEYGQSRHFGKNTNIIASLQKDDRTNKNYRFRGVGYLEGKFLKDFTLRTDISLDYVNVNDNLYGNMEFGDFSSLGGVVQKTLQTNMSYTWRQMLTWKPSFGIFAEGHNLSATLDHENYLVNNNVYFLERSGFTGPEFKEPSAAAVSGASDGYLNTLAMESYLALANYDYQGKYFLSGSIRRDGTSRFASDSRWGNFWSIGGSWVLTQESFLKNKFDWLSLVKVRASYGTQGQENLGSYYAWLPRYYFNPNGANPGYSFNSWGNPDLKWEGKYMLNIGADLGFMNDRFIASFDYYRSGSFDLLYVRPYPLSTGIGGIQDNVGELRNSGIEIALRGDVIRTSNFTWNVSLNAQKVVNKMASMQGSDSIVGGGTIMAKGLPIGAYFMPVYAGVNPENGDELWKLADGTTTADYVTANQTENMQYVGSPFRDLEGSVENSLSYKGFDFYLQVTYGLGGKFYDGNYQRLMAPDNAFQGFAWSPDILNAWTNDNKSGTIPRVGVNEDNIGNISDRFLMSSSFLKVQSAKLAYNLPSRWLTDAKISTAKVFISGDNLFLLTGRKGVDIQQDYFGSSSLSYYPYRTIMFGINLSF